MIAIKNADGTLVPVSEGTAGASRTVALSLVHSNQKRAEIQLFEVGDIAPDEHPELEPGQEPFGVLVLKRLPENPFGEVEITATIDIDDELHVHVRAEADGIKPVSGVFALPGNPAIVANAPDDDALLEDELFGADQPEDELELPPPMTDDLLETESEDSLAEIEAEPAENLFDMDFNLDEADAAASADAGAAEEPGLPAESDSSLDDFLSSDTLEEPAVAPAEASGDAFLDDPDDTDWGFDELADASLDPDAPAETDPLPKADILPEADEAPPVEAGFLDDPDNTDWGFDELADAADEDGLAAPVSTSQEDDSPAMPDLSFDDAPMDAMDSMDFDTSLDNVDDIEGQGAASDSGADFDLPGGSDDDADLFAERAEPDSPEPARPIRAKQAPQRRPHPASSGVMPRLMKASVVMFAISLVELGVYLFLRMRFFP